MSRAICSRRVLRAGLLVGATLLGGCASNPVTSLERATSFQSLAGRQIGTEPLRDFVTRRTALLIGGMPPEGATALPLDSIAHAMKALRGRYAMGSATAIDGRGYFLTAAHCVATKPLHLVRREAGRVRLSPVRIVWQGDSAKEGGDLAVLAIDETVSGYFAWADAIKMGDAVVGVGLDYDDPANFQLGCFSGVALKRERHAAMVPPGETIYHSSPVHLGDSGGPLTTTEGRLVGINVGDVHEYDLLHWRHQTAARAHRPDLRWLQALLDHDFALKRGPATAAL